LRIGDEGLTHIGKSCPKLQDIDLYRSVLDTPCRSLSLILFCGYKLTYIVHVSGVEALVMMGLFRLLKAAQC
jgi:hypothetical protein